MINADARSDWATSRSQLQFAFAGDALLRFVGALDAIFRLVVAWKLYDHLENTTGTNR
jgi:hypothetical protein